MSEHKVELDAIDHRIVTELQRDGRISINELATRAQVSRTTAYARFQRLQESGVITGFRADLDPGKLGVNVAALILANIDQRSWPELMQGFTDLPGLEYMAATTGDFDLVLVVRVPDVATLRDDVLKRLQAHPKIRSTKTTLVLEDRNQSPRLAPV